jgi:hypothetical protein
LFDRSWFAPFCLVTKRIPDLSIINLQKLCYTSKHLAAHAFT